MSKKTTDLPQAYREGVGLMLLNPRREVFVAQRLDMPSDAWQMPQGGIDKGETPRQAALRELEEETGLTDVLLGPCVWLREHRARLGGRWYAVDEQYFIGQVPRPVEIARTGWTDLELQELAECRWWSMDEIAASEDIFVPRRLAALLPPILRGEYPGVPIRTD